LLDGIKHANRIQTLHKREDNETGTVYGDCGRADGAPTTFEVERPDRLFRGRLHSLVDVPIVVAEFKKRFPDAAVWFDRLGVNVVLDPLKLDQFFRLGITETRIFSALSDLGSGTAFEQMELVEKIRSEFAGGHLIDTTFLQSIRQLKWSTGDVAEGEVAHASAAMRQSVEMKVSGAEAIPESIEFRVPVLDLPELDTLRSIRVTVTLAMSRRRIILTPEGDAISNAVRAAEAELREKLAALLLGPALPTDVPSSAPDDGGTSGLIQRSICPLIGGAPSLVGSV